MPKALPVAARRHPLVAHLRRRLLGRCALPRGARVVVGCSGGADSLALLIGSVVLRDRPAARGSDVDPLAVHVHHHLREGADDDAAFVVGACRSLGVPCRVLDVEPGRCAGNVAAAARALRYDALARAAADLGAARVAVAHHAEDQLETMLMALGRGAGIEALGGMQYVAPMVGHDRLVLLRPLLDASRRDCEALCAAAGFGWRDDPGNQDLTKSRARVRHDVMPVLESLWPGAAARAAGTAELLGAASVALDAVLAERFGPPSCRSWSRDLLRTLPIPVIAAGLRRAALDAMGGPCDALGQRQLARAAEAVADAVRRPRRMSWPQGLSMRISASRVELGARNTRA